MSEFSRGTEPTEVMFLFSKELAMGVWRLKQGGQEGRRGSERTPRPTDLPSSQLGSLNSGQAQAGAGTGVRLDQTSRWWPVDRCRAAGSWRGKMGLMCGGAHLKAGLGENDIISVCVSFVLPYASPQKHQHKYIYHQATYNSNRPFPPKKTHETKQNKKQNKSVWLTKLWAI